MARKRQISHRWSLVMRLSLVLFHALPLHRWNELPFFDKQTMTDSTPKEISAFQCQLISFEILYRIFKNEGVSGLFRGNYVNCLRVAPCSAVEFYSFEVYKKAVSKHLTNTREEIRSVKQKPDRRRFGWNVSLHSCVSNGPC